MKGIKKIICAILSVGMICANLMPAFAYDEPTLRCEVTLTSENGTKYLVNAIEVPEARVYDDNGETRTFEFSLDKDNMVMLTRGNQYNDDWDDSKGVMGYISIHYDSRTRSDGNKEYLLENVSGGWTIDDSSIRLSDRIVAYTCQDASDFDQIVFKEPNGNTFDYDTNFTEYSYKTLFGVLGASSEVVLKRGTREEWDLRIECNFFDNNILQLIDSER